MPPRIVLTETPRYVNTSRWSRPLCIHPSDGGGIVGCDSVPLDEFATAPQDYLADYETAIFLQLMDMISPSNRTDDIWEFTFNQMSMPTVSIDEYLFRSDPWRAWFHFGLVDAEYRDYTYSYLAESDYDQYFNGLSDDNPFSLAEIRDWGENIIESRYTRYFRTFDVTIGHEATPAEEYEYSERLDDLFDQKNTVGQVRRALADYAADIYSDRHLPTRHQLFRGDKEWDVRITNLPVDRWKASHLQTLVDLTDSIGEAFYVES